MNQSVNSTLPDEPLNQTPDDALPLDANIKFSDFLRFATEEIEANLKAGRVLQQQIAAQSLLINEMLARLMTT